jgi:hypothetical protein
METIVKVLHPFLKKIWQVPAEWKEEYLMKLPKKGDLSNYGNYRGITVLSVQEKSSTGSYCTG